MHAAGMWTAFAAIMAGPPVVLYDTVQKLDPRSVWETARAGKGRHDDDGRRRLRRPHWSPSCRRGSYDLSSLYAIGTGGAATNPKYQRALLECHSAHHHHQRIRLVGNREHGRSGTAGAAPGPTPSTFREGGLVLSDDYSRFL